MLLAAAGIVFIIACSNVANLILARSVRREGELAVRAALGASPGALRRTLLAESLVLCGAGAVLGVLLARPFVSVVARFAARFSVRALDVTVDPSLLWVGAGLAMAAAVLLAYVPRLPSADGSASATSWLWRTRRVGPPPADRRASLACWVAAPTAAGCGSRLAACGSRQRPIDAFASLHGADCVLVRVARGCRHPGRRPHRAADGDDRLQHAAGAGDRLPAQSLGLGTSQISVL